MSQKDNRSELHGGEGCRGGNHWWSLCSCYCVAVYSASVTTMMLPASLPYRVPVLCCRGCHCPSALGTVRPPHRDAPVYVYTTRA